MTLALYGKSRKRQGGLLLAALLAVLGATIGGLMLIGTAFAHNTTYTATTQCDGSWSAQGGYANGGTPPGSGDRRLVLIKNVIINGVAFDPSWASGYATQTTGTPVRSNGVITYAAYAAIPGSMAGLTAPGSGESYYVWVGDDTSWSIFNRSGAAGTFASGSANWAGNLDLYEWSSNKWVRNSGYSQAVTAPSAPTNCATLTVKKVVNSGAPAQDFTTKIVNSKNSDGAQVGATFSVAAKFTETFTNSNSSADFTITEVSIPLGWANDAYAIVNGADGVCPTYGQSGGAWTTSGDPKLSNLGNNSKTVCFKNTYTPPTGKVQVHKYLPQANGQPWQNVGNGQSSYEFTIYKDQAMTQQVTTFSQLGPNSSSVPQDIDLWIKETDTNGQQFAGFFFPDGNGDSSGNAKCNQQPADGSTFSSSVPTKIDKSRWGTPGNLTGLLHICAYNKPAQPDLKATKSNNVGGSVTSPAGFTWSITVENAGTAQAKFKKNEVVFVDNLPTGPVYTLVAATGTTTKLSCSLASNTITCTASDDYFRLNAGESFTVGVSVASTAGLSGNLVNPKVDGKCMVDPADKESESNENNNTCGDTVVVKEPIVLAPSVSKVAHSPATAGSWDIVITNPNPGGVVQPSVTITDSKTDISIDSGASTLNGAACSVLSGVITCTNVGLGTTTIVVTRPVNGSTLASGSLCAGGTIENSLSSAKAGDTTLAIGTGGTAVSETVAADLAACGQPTIVKTLVDGGTNATSVTNPADVKWQITVTNPANGQDPRSIQVKDTGVAIVSGPTYSGPATTSCTGALTDTNGANCSVKAGGSVTWVVSPATTPVRQCAGQDFTNTAQFSLTQVAPTWQDAAGPKITLTADVASCTKTVIFGKYVCNAYSDVQANEDAANASYNDIGTHVTDLIAAGGALGNNDAVTPNNDGRIAANCHLEPWDFVLKDGNNTSVVTQHISLGSAALTPVTINAASMALALQPTRLRVEEVMKTGYGFAGIKCYTDHLHSDNWEWIDFSGGIPQGDVYCLAYNVKPPRTVEVCKVIDQNNDGIADGGDFTFDVRAQGGANFDKVTLTATEGGQAACKTITVPDNSQSSAIEVVEWGAPARPAGWGSDASGYPKISVNGGALSSNGTANLGNTGNGTVTFHNKKTPADQHVTFIKVVCANFSDVPRNLEVAGIGWGTNDMPAGYDQNSLGAAGPAGANDPVTPANIPGNCVTVPGWNFDLKDSGGTFFRTVTTAGSIGSAGIDVTLTPAELQSALQPWHDSNGYHGLYVSEQKQTGYGFAALKCYEDHKLLDNTDGINLTAAGTEGVYCIAYNVADPVTVGVAKSNNLDGSQVSAGASFNWTITVTVGGAPTVNPVHVTDSLPTGFTTTSVAGTGFDCTLSTTTTVDCTLPAGAAVGTHTITVTVTAPKPDANVCKPYTNTVNIGDLVFDERLLSQVALDIPRDQTYNPDTATNDVTVKDCTGTVIVKKIVESSSSVNPNDTSPAFTGLFDGSSWGNLQNNGTHTFNNVLAGGNHTITEALGTVNVPGDSLWHNDGFFAASEGVCPTGAAGLTPLTPSNITVVAGQTTTICVLNRRDQPNTLTATVFVYKVIASAFPSATDTFTGTVSSPNGGGNFSITTAAGASFPISLDSDHPDTTFSASEAAKAGYTTLGYKVLAGNAACPAPDGNYLSSVSSHAIGQASSTAYTVCIYNDPRVSITVHKTEQNGAATGAGQGWNVTLTGCGITPQQATTDASGNASFTNLPLCNAYFVSEDLNSKGNGAYLAASGFPTTVMVNATTAGSSYPVNFSNIHFIPPPLCLFGCSPLIITTPTVTPTSTPTPTLTTKPTEPTKTEKPEEPKKTPTTNIDVVGGEKTPGPGANATPLAPSTGSGLFGTGKSGSNLLLAVMGIFALSAGFAVIAVANKGKSCS